MDPHRYIEQIVGPATICEKMEAVRVLSGCTHEPMVMAALCETAVQTTSHRIREAVIDALGSNLSGAYSRFTDEAMHAPNPSRRKWALVNLSLLRCREAKDAVLQGLQDTNASVRKAAAMSAGLYDDDDVHHALERYFERHRFELTISFVATGCKALRKRIDTPDDEDPSGRFICVSP